MSANCHLVLYDASACFDRARIAGPCQAINQRAFSRSGASGYNNQLFGIYGHGDSLVGVIDRRRCRQAAGLIKLGRVRKGKVGMSASSRAGRHWRPRGKGLLPREGGPAPAMSIMRMAARHSARARKNNPLPRAAQLRAGRGRVPSGCRRSGRRARICS